jgi:hypothetical protein
VADTPSSEVPTTGSHRSKAGTTAGSDTNYTPIADEAPPSMGRTYTPYGTPLVVLNADRLVGITITMHVLCLPLVWLSTGVKAADDDDDAYDADAFETGDEALDPFRREDGADSTRNSGEYGPEAAAAAAAAAQAQAENKHRRATREYHSEKVDFVQFETGNAAVDDAQEEAYEAYNVHDVLEPVAAHELEAMSALRHPPPRLRLACAGILILLSRMDGEEQVPQEISFRAFCRLAHTADFVASLMNSINPATISRVKIAALESYVGHLDGSHDYLGR